MEYFLFFFFELFNFLMISKFVLFAFIMMILLCYFKICHQAEAQANVEYESDVDEDERALAQAIRDRAAVMKREVRF